MAGQGGLRIKQHELITIRQKIEINGWSKSQNMLVKYNTYCWSSDPTKRQLSDSAGSEAPAGSEVEVLPVLEAPVGTEASVQTGASGETEALLKPEHLFLPEHGFKLQCFFYWINNLVFLMWLISRKMTV